METGRRCVALSAYRFSVIHLSQLLSYLVPLDKIYQAYQDDIKTILASLFLPCSGEVWLIQPAEGMASDDLRQMTLEVS